MSDSVTIENAGGTWVVRSGGAVIGESSNALRVREEGYPDRVYFPRGDIAMAFLEQSETTTHCPKKGDASYYSIVAESRTIADAAWSYEEPMEDVAQLKERIAFDGENDDVTVEQL